MKLYKKYWLALIAVLLVTFSILGYFGKEIYRQAPPIPEQVISPNGQLVYTQASILAGQSAWQSMGGMELGSIFGHGAYQAPDWTADWLHRELVAWLDLSAQAQFAKPYAQLTAAQQAGLQMELQAEYRQSRPDAAGVVHISAHRAQAAAQVASYYDKLFSAAPELKETRVHYAMKENTLPSAQKRADMAGFFFWTAWAASTERPSTDGSKMSTYTNNWPPEPLVANHPTAENIVWSIVSVACMMAGVGLMVWFWAFFRNKEEDHVVLPKKDPLLGIALTPSQRALAKYAFLVVALFIAQIFLGAFTAHYTVEGQTFYGIDVSQWLPYSLTRTWHLQTALWWIAGGFLAIGLFLAPYINGGKDPAYQKLGVDVLFGALIVVVVGSYVGNYLSIAQLMPEKLNFWLGHQGYEYVDLGRVWQIGKFTGLLVWLVLVLRALLPALKAGKTEDRNLLWLLTFSVIAIGLFYASGFFYGEHTHITIMEYWRWWIVHLWVEGIFEVFATTALAFLFVTLGLVSLRTGTTAALMSASIFMVGGVPGTFHHLYFSGTTTPVMAIGACFSALEVVPLILMGHEAWENWNQSNKTEWMRRLKWPVMFFTAVAFWNMLGAGVFGFFINPPISLYYLQGLNMTALHAHGALFGVYGFLSLGFVLLMMRYLRPNFAFSEGQMKTAFWAMNIGLGMMMFTSLLPVGLFQFHASISEGMWYARSAEFLQQGYLVDLRWFRTFGDVVFMIGALTYAWQVIKALAYSEK
jgi:nitric oxide reductase subunit B